MNKRFADNRAAFATKRDYFAKAQAVAHARSTATPVFADIKRFSEPSATRMVWMPTTTGLHPSFV